MGVSAHEKPQELRRSPSYFEVVPPLPPQVWESSYPGGGGEGGECSALVMRLPRECCADCSTAAIQEGTKHDVKLVGQHNKKNMQTQRKRSHVSNMDSGREAAALEEHSKMQYSFVSSPYALHALLATRQLRTTCLNSVRALMLASQQFEKGANTEKHASHNNWKATHREQSKTSNVAS